MKPTSWPSSCTRCPVRTVKREIAKNIVTVLLAGKVSVERIERIHREIDASHYTTSEPKIIVDAKNAGLVGEKTASVALGFDEEEYLAAREDHTARILRIAMAQSSSDESSDNSNDDSNATSDPAARGIDDLSADPAGAGSEEKAESRTTRYATRRQIALVVWVRNRRGDASPWQLRKKLMARSRKRRTISLCGCTNMPGRRLIRSIVPGVARCHTGDRHAELQGPQTFGS